MSDDGDIDVESAEDVPDIAVEATATTAEDRSELYSPKGGPLDKRAHHNALERRRRDHIKDSFHGLRDSIPSLCGEKISRAIILNKATDYIRVMQKSGSLRENEIQDLKKRNEVLEEQVRALEAARALGSTENAEEILQSVAEKVENRQRQQQSKSSSTNVAGKTERAVTDKSAKTSQLTGSAPTKPPAAGIKSGESSSSLTNHISMLAKNQSLLTVLQKNLSSPNLPASIKSLAARVLASPLGRAPVNSGGSLPRGIVTATTVPKGSSFVSSPLPSTLQQQLQTTKPDEVSAQSPVKSAADSSTVLTTKATDNNKVSLSDVSNCTSIAPPAMLADPITEDKPATDSPLPVTQTSSSGDHNSSTGAPVVSVSSPLSSPSSLSVATSEVTATSLASQLLDAHSLLQKQGAGSPCMTNSNKPLISPELIAQVSSFLNLPSLSTTPLPTVSESGTTSKDRNSVAECLSSESVLRGVKRPNSTQDLDTEHSKKIHLEA